MKDKLWFFGSYLPSLEKFTRTTNFSDGTPVTRKQTDNTHYYSANLTSQLTNSTRGKVALNSCQAQHHRRPAGPLAADENWHDEPGALLDTQRHPAELVALGQLRLGRQRQVLRRRARRLLQQRPVQRRRPERDTVHLQRAPRTSGWRACRRSSSTPPTTRTCPGNRSITRNILARGNLQVDGTYFASMAGSHTIKGGVQLDRIGNDVLDSELQNRVSIFWNRSLSSTLPRGQFGYYSVRSNGVNPEQGFSAQGNIAKPTSGSSSRTHGRSTTG